jgi:CBS domain-containing protein
MTNVHEILSEKGTDVWTISSAALVEEGLALMAQHDVGALVVLDGTSIAGIFSERDYARKVALMGRSSVNTHISDIMTAKVVTVHPGQTIDECMDLMTDHHIRHLPVVDGTSLRGLISIGDVVKALINDHEATIRHLEQYISGGA